MVAVGGVCASDPMQWDQPIMENIVQGVSLPGEVTCQEYDLRRALTDEP